MTTIDTAAAPVDEDNINVDAMEKQATGSNRLKLLPFKDGTNVYRILPPFGKVAKEKGFPFAELYLHWWRNETAKTGFPVLCTKKSDKEGCPICDAVDKMNEALEKSLAPYTSTTGDKKKVNWDKVPPALKEEAKRARDIGWQRHYYYNAVSTSGEVGVLKLPKTLGDKLNLKIRDTVRERKFNPVSRKDGVFFLLTRTKSNTGKFDFEVDYKKQTVKLPDGDTAEKIVKGPLADDILAKLETSMRDLYDLFKVQTAASLREVMAKKGKDDSDSFNPADYNEDEAFSGESKPSTGPAPFEDVQDPSDDDVDVLAGELGLTGASKTA